MSQRYDQFDSNPNFIWIEVRLEAFWMLITFDPLGIKFLVVPESAIAFVLALQFLWVDTFSVI